LELGVKGEPDEKWEKEGMKDLGKKKTNMRKTDREGGGRKCLRCVAGESERIV